MNKKAAPLDRESLQKWLNQQLGGGVTVRALHAPTNGYSAATLLIDADIESAGIVTARRWVLRLEKQDRHIFRDTDIARQGQMMRALAAHGLPAPNVIAIETDSAVLGGKFLLMDRIDGVSLPQHPNYHSEGLLTRLAAGRRRSLWADAITTIASINALERSPDFDFLDKPQYGAAGLDQYLGWLAAWRDEAMEGRANPVLDAALNRLLGDKPDNRHVEVLWGDSNPGNFLFSESGGVAAVLDFEAAALGPAEIDLGWWFYVDDLISFGSERLPGLPDRAEIIALFEATLGRKTSDLAYYEMLAALRMGLVIARTVNLLIRSGALPPDNTAACNNPCTQWLAMHMNIPAGDTGADFMAFTQAMNDG